MGSLWWAELDRLHSMTRAHPPLSERVNCAGGGQGMEGGAGTAVSHPMIVRVPPTSVFAYTKSYIIQRSPSWRGLE